MPKRISSSGWIGTNGIKARQGPFTYDVGQHSIASDYQRIVAAKHPLFEFPSETRRTRRLAAWLLLSPILLWLSWLIVGFSIPDRPVEDNSEFLLFGGLGLIAVAVWQLQSRSTAFIGLRNALLAIALVTMCAAAILYSYLAVGAHARAIASNPERTFELVKTEGHRIKRTIISHQRANGSTVEGINQGRPLPYSRVCALVQRLDGLHGFSWVRVLERSRTASRGQLAWPVRREDCFSNTPLSLLPR